MLAFARFVVVVLLAAFAIAQDFKGVANFPATPNGPITLDVTLNNSDVSNQGVGTIKNVNGMLVNQSVWWRRARNGLAFDVTIYADETRTVILGVLRGSPRGQPIAPAAGSGGAATLNNPPPNAPSAGTYSRTS